MIDTLSILISTMLCVFIIYRAVKLDRVLPWYSASRADAEEPSSPSTNGQQTWVPDWERDTSLEFHRLERE